MAEPKAPDGADPHVGTDDLTEAVDRIGRSAWGLGTRLFGPKWMPPPRGDQTPLSPEAEVAIQVAGATLGRWLHAAGKGLEAHPKDPIAAVTAAREQLSEVPEPAEGETVLTAGVRELGGGLYKIAEGVLDVVAPRSKPAGGEPPREGGEP
ncbi:MAG: hypothetical protein EXR69_03800 [Myxococcales bacterium]|nr:hypothetical protein [Myxococcales bacterium]